MDENNIIICYNCYEENENTRTTCKRCGAKLYNNNAEKNIEKQEKVENEAIRKESTDNEDIRDKMMEHFTNVNKVALIIKIVAIVGVIVGAGYGCTLFDSAYTEEIGIVYIIVSIISAVFIYALGEIIQLLEDIKNK